FDEIKGETSKDKIKQLKSFNLEYEKHNTITNHSIVDVYDHIIKDWYDLNTIRYNSYDGDTQYAEYGTPFEGVYLLKSNLDKNSAGYKKLASKTANNGKGWEPLIGDPYSGRFYFETFIGVFEGNNHIIKDLYINRSDEDYASLFGMLGNKFVESDAKIMNLGMENIGINGGNSVGGITGNNKGVIKNSYVKGLIESSSSAGGIAGGNYGVIVNSYFRGNIEGTNKVGGIAGGNYGVIVNSNVEGKIKGIEKVGGLVGDNKNEIKNSYFKGELLGEDEIGGIAGINDYGSIIKNSFADLNIDAINSKDMGGIAGTNYEIIRNSYASGEINGDVSLGGLAANNHGIIDRSYSTIKISGSDNIGLLVNSNFGTVKDSFVLEDDILLIDNSNTTTSEILGRTTKVNEEEMRGNEIYTVNPIDGYENLIDLWSEDIWDLGDDSVNSHSYPSLYWQKE
ncbi:MAG TPA: hypothetical protein VKN64_01705, partial [Halanaerobiales bacterium]|nr:hypothetical protein [Halanaerobiales bacterium]